MRTCRMAGRCADVRPHGEPGGTGRPGDGDDEVTAATVTAAAVSAVRASAAAHADFIACPPGPWPIVIACPPGPWPIVIACPTGPRPIVIASPARPLADRRIPGPRPAPFRR